jgi:hypothetical protein
MTKPDALMLANQLQQQAVWEGHYGPSVLRDLLPVAAAELRRLHHNNLVLTDALWKACGDDEGVVNATIESQGELK